MDNVYFDVFGAVMEFKIRNALANAEDDLLYALEHMKSGGGDEDYLVELQTAIDLIKRVLGGL
jgi:hypothetical protein